MHIVKRIKKKLKAKRSHVDVKEVQALYDYLRKDILNKADILELLKSEDFSSLVDMAVYAEPGGMALWTAIQAAFCMGYEAGKAGRHSDGE